MLRFSAQCLVRQRIHAHAPDLGAFEDAHILSVKVAALVVVLGSGLFRWSFVISRCVPLFVGRPAMTGIMQFFDVAALVEAAVGSMLVFDTTRAVFPCLSPRTAAVTRSWLVLLVTVTLALCSPWVVWPRTLGSMVGMDQNDSYAVGLHVLVYGRLAPLSEVAGPQRSDRTVRHSAVEPPTPGCVVMVQELEAHDNTTTQYLLKKALQQKKVDEEVEEEEELLNVPPRLGTPAHWAQLRELVGSSSQSKRRRGRRGGRRNFLDLPRGALLGSTVDTCSCLGSGGFFDDLHTCPLKPGLSM